MQLITSTPRSGTTYTASVLRALGCDVDLEETERDPAYLVTYRWPKYLETADAVYHLVRNPINTISSMQTIGEQALERLDRSTVNNGVVEWEVEALAEYWALWHEQLYKVCGARVYRVEYDLDVLLADLGVDSTVAAAQGDLDRNSRAGRYEQITLDTIRDIDADVAARVEELGHRMGYPL